MTIKSVLFHKQPNWQLNRQGLNHRMPVSVQSWVYERDSLTQRLRDAFGNAVAVDILMQHWSKPFLAERKLLDLPDAQFCFTREVMLHVNHHALILARTIIPKQTVKLASANLTHLGARPLGEVIFSCPGLQRQALAITTIAPVDWTPSVKNLTPITQPIWGRSTLYAVEHKQMLVSEFFLPPVLAEYDLPDFEQIVSYAY